MRSTEFAITKENLLDTLLSQIYWTHYYRTVHI